MPDPALTAAAGEAAAIGAALWDGAAFDAAWPHLERALEHDPQQWEALHTMGRIALARNELPGALLLLERAVEVAADLPGARGAEFLLRSRRDLAWALYRLERFDLAARELARLPDQGPLAAQLAALAGQSPYRLRGPDQSQIALLGNDPLPVVPINIGGTDYPFVVDSGAGQLVIDREIARSLDLPRLATGEAQFASGERAAIGYSVLSDLTFGDYQVAQVPVEVMEVSRMAPQIAGIVGSVFLQRFNLLFDWEQARLTLRRRPAPPFQMQGWSELPFWMVDDHLLLTRAEVNGTETMAFVASGVAGAAFGIAESLRQRAGVVASGPTVSAVSVGGERAMEGLQAERLCLGTWCRSGVEGLAALFPPALEWRYGFQIGLLVGHDFLRAGQWSVDFDRMQMAFR